MTIFQKTNQMRCYGWLFLGIVVVRITISLLFRFLFGEKVNAPLLLFISQILYMIPALIFVHSKKTGFLRTFRFNRISTATIFLMPVAALLVMPVVAFVNGISMLFTKNEIIGSLGTMIPEIAYLPMLFVAAAVPAVCEEGVYRGVLLSGYEKGGMWKGITCSAFLFALLHLNLNQFMYAFIFGIIMGVVVEITGSIFASMIIHFCMNGMSITLLYLLESFYSGQLADMRQVSSQVVSPGLLVVIVVYGFISVFTISSLIGLLYLVARLEGRGKYFAVLNPLSEWREKPYVERIFSLPLILAIMICFGFIVFLQWQ